MNPHPLPANATPGRLLSRPSHQAFPAFVLAALLVLPHTATATSFSLPSPPPGVDTHGTGMSDLWQRHFNNGHLFDPANPDHHPDADPDGDGWTNLQESIAGTDPFSGQAPEGLAISYVTYLKDQQEAPTPEFPDGRLIDLAIVSWDAVPGKIYSLEASPDLDAESWIEVAGPFYSYYGEPEAVSLLLTDGTGEKPAHLFWRVHIADVDSDGDGLTDYEEWLLGSNPFSEFTTDTGIPDLWIAQHFGHIPGIFQAQAFNPNAEAPGGGASILDHYLSGTDPNTPPGETHIPWFIVHGNAPVGVPVTRQRQSTFPAGTKVLVLVATASAEFSEWTNPITSSNEFNDILEWDIQPNFGDRIKDDVNVNANHGKWTNHGKTIPGMINTAYYEYIGLLEAPPEEELVIDITLTATNVADGNFPSEVAVALLPVELWDIKDHDDEHDDVMILPWDTTQNIAEENIAWIEAHTSATDPAPRMPQLELRVPGLPEALTIEARLNVQYTRGNGARPARNQPEDRVRIPANGDFAQVDGGSWEIYNEETHQNELTEGGFFGGEATLTYQLMNEGDIVVGPEDINFRIGGENPEPLRARAYIETLQDAGPQGNLWFAYAIARHETRDRNGNGTRYNHFWNLGARWHNVPQESGFPVWNDDGPGLPGGYGLFQVTMPDIPRGAIWNWQTNVHEALAILRQKRDEAAAFMASQRQQAGAANPLPAHTVGPVTFTDGTNRIMEHAVTIKAYNGASRPNFAFTDNGEAPGFILDPHSSGHYCYWRDRMLVQTNPNDPRLSQGTVVDANPIGWALSRYNAYSNPFNYVQNVCNEVED